MFDEAKTKSHSNRAVDAIRELIFAGELPAGSDHLESELAAQPYQSNEDHRALYEAIASGDSKAAREIHWRHRTEAKDMLIRLLDQLGVRRV